MANTQETSKKSPLKKIIKIGASIFAVIIIILATLPFFIDIDAKLRPVITQTIEDNLDVKAELGRLSLNLLWGVNVGIENLKLTENKTKNVLFELQNAKLSIPYSSLLLGRISVTLNTEKPIIRVTRYKDGTLNVTKLMKSKEPTQGASDSGGASGAALGSRLSFSTNIQKAELLFKDDVSGFNYKIDDLALILDNVGINKDFDILVKTHLNVDNKKDIALDGTLSFEGKTNIQMGVEGFQSIRLNSKLDLSDIEVRYAKLLNKPKEIPLIINAELTATKNSANIEKLEMNAGKLSVTAAGTVQNFDRPTVDFKVTSSGLDLEKWQPVIAPLKDFDMKGKLNLDIKLTGTSPNYNLNGKFDYKDGSLKVAAIKPRVTDINMSVVMSGQTMQIQNTGLKIGSSDMKLSGTVKNFAAPEVDLIMNSKFLNLDEMMPPSPEAKKQAAKESPKGASGEDVAVMVAGPLAMMQSNPTIRNLDLKATTSVAKLIVKNATIEDLKADAYFKNLVLTIKNASLKTFNGQAKVFAQFDLSSQTPTYQFTADVANLDINQAVVSQFKELDKTITGKANGNIIVSGTGLAQAQVKRNLKGSGKFNIKDGAWSGAVPLKKIGEKLSGIPGVGDKLAGVKIDDRFKIFNADFMIQNGALNIQKAMVDTMQSNTAIEASGSIDFDQNLKMKGNVLAPIKDVPKDLKAADGRGKIPFELLGTVTAPDVEWESTVRTIGKAYAKDEGKKLLNKGLEKAQDKLPENVKKLFKGLKF